MIKRWRFILILQCIVSLTTKNSIIFINVEYRLSRGEMSEWLKEHAWKACVGETLPGVRIPIFPPLKLSVLDGEIAVPCNLQSATAGLNSSLRF
jgi:hypothetical protein